MPHVQIRDVPPDVHRRLKSQAALAGQSLNDFLRERISEIARLPTLGELTEQINHRERYTGPSSAELVRQTRDQR